MPSYSVLLFACALGFAAFSHATSEVCSNYVGESGFLTPEDALCTCAGTETCVGKCCPSTGKCKSASCSGNKISTGHEHECVVDKDGFNKGGQCPWNGQTYGVYCNYLAGCEVGKKNNCWGYTTCGVGTCPATAVGVFCIESGNSGNFKVCECDSAVTDTCQGNVIANCDNYSTAYNKKLVVAAGNGVLKNDAGATSAQLVDTTANGVLVFNPDGSFEYTPKTDYCGTDTFTYKAVDGDCYDTEKVAITVTCGCGSDVAIVQCKLKVGDATTNCALPGGQMLVVPNVAGYTRARIRVSARVSYKV